MMIIRMLLGAVFTGMRNWKVAVMVVAGGVIAVLLIERNTARREVADQARTLAIRQAQIEQLQANVTQLTHAIEEQNTAVDHLKADADQRQQAATVALVRSQQASVALETEIARLNEKNSATDAAGRTCDDALREWRAGR